MKKKAKTSKSLRAGPRKSRLGQYVLGASLIVLGTQVPAADSKLTPEQSFEGGTNTYSNWIELGGGGLMTTGNKNAAAQQDGMNPGGFGGIQDLHYQTEVAKKTTLTVDGRSIFGQNDYNIGVGLTREDFGFFRFNIQNARTWDSGIGGYIPGQQTYALPGDPLYLDRSQISLEAGLTKPNLPQMTLKYNHRAANGEESSTLWGPVHDANNNLLRAYPGILNLDEKSDAVQFELTHKYKKINYGAGVGYEHGDLTDTHYLTYYQGEPIQQKVTDQQGTTYDLVSTHAFAESWIKNNLFLSSGFMFANLDDTFTGSRIYGEDFDVAYSPYANAGYGYTSLNGGAHKHEYIGNVNLMALPTKTFTITPSLRVQKEDWNANSSGMASLSDYSQEPFNSNSGRDLIEVCERLDLRYTGITNWVFNAGGQWTEGQGNLNEYGGLTQVNGIGPAPVQFSTDDSRLFQKYFASTRWYPTRKAAVDVGGYYKINTYNYDNTQNPNFGTGADYPGFILYQGFETLDGNIRLTLHPFNKITLVSRYEYQYSTIDTEPTPASGLNQTESSVMHSQIIGQNVSWTPLTWLGLQAGINYVLSTTETPNSSYTQSVLNSQNNYWTANVNSDFVLDDKTDLNVGYFYYHADDFSIPVNGLALGAATEEHAATATLSRRITQYLRCNLKFAFTHNQDYSTGGYGSFNSYLISSSLQYRF